MPSRCFLLALALASMVACSNAVLVGQSGDATSSTAGSTSGGASSSSSTSSTGPSTSTGPGGQDGTSTSSGSSSSGCVPATCIPQDCASQGIDSFCAGPATDGCGNLLECGLCAVPAECCGAVTMPPTNPELLGCLGSFCAPATCATFGLSCGTVGDGCGNMLDCGSCPPGETCGGGGPGVCGKMPCAPLTCASLGFECGTWGDGCGGTLDCGTCDPCTPACGQGGVRGQCPVKLVSFCMPTTCADEGIACGPTSDGCGAPLDCGACPTPLSCGKGVCLPVCM